MLLKLFFFSLIIMFSAAPLWARATADVEREFDAFRAKATVNPKVGKAEQFLEKLTTDRQADDIIAMLNKGEGVRGFSKKNRRFTPEEEKIALNALFFAKKNKSGIFPFKEGIDDYGPPAVQRHRHFVKVAWRLLDPTLGYVSIGTNFKTDDRAYREFRALVRAQMKFENSDLQVHGEDEGAYVDNGVGITQQYGFVKLPKIPCFHAYYPANYNDETLVGYSIASSLRLRLSTHEARKFLPQNVQEATKDISDEKLDIFAMAQNLSWDEATLYRPQSWLDPDAPFEQEGYDHAFDVALSSYPTPTGNTISHVENIHSIGLNSHTQTVVEVKHIEGQPDQKIITNYVVSSGNEPSAEGIFAEKRKTNFTLYSLTKVNNVLAYAPATGSIQTPGRYALTLHLMLNKAGQRRMGEIAKNLSEMWGSKKIYHLSELLDADPILSQLYRLGF